jgi:hypothetical protein
MASSTQLFPEVIDGSTLGARVASAVFLPIGVEGGADAAGDCVVGTVYTITRDADAIAHFGPNSTLTLLLEFLLARGVAPIYAVASKKGTVPLLADRQAAWQVLEMSRDVRLRLTDSTTTADLAALAVSCNNANLLNNKHVAFCGVPVAQTKAQAITVAGAIANARATLIAPGVYDMDGTLKSGAYAAAAVAAAIAKNPDIADDMDTAELENLLAIEKDASGNSVFREIVVGGSLVNDFEDLLQGGVSPLMPGRNGGVAISHLRMTYTTDSRWDALMTRLIVDQLFVLVREYAYNFQSLRKANTQLNRDLLASGIQSLLNSHRDWVAPLPGFDDFQVTVTASPDNRQQIIHYAGEVNRGAQTIVVDGNLSITV